MRCLGWRLGSDPHFGFDQIAEFQPFQIIVYCLLVFETSPDAIASFQIADVIGNFEVKGIGALAEAAKQNPISGLRLFKGCYKHQERVCHPGFAAHFMHVVHQFFRGSAQLLGNLAMITLEKTGINQLVDIIHGNFQFVKETVGHLRNDNAIAGIPGPAFFPYIIVLFIRSAVMVHKITGQ